MSQKIIIVGGGLSGTLTALYLSEFPDRFHVLLIEKKPELLGRGIAYQCDFTHQPLNVVAGAMSLYPDMPMDFVNWLESNQFQYNHLIEKVSPQEFIPRKIFGDYVLENLERAQHQSAGKLQIRIDEAIAIVDSGTQKIVVLASGTEFHADHVILALGNFPPADPFPTDNPVARSPRYFAGPWSDKVYSGLTGDEDILLVGSGLTAVDIVLGFILRKFRGKITLLSRRGRLPLAHDLSHPPFQIDGLEIKHPRKMLLWIRRLIRNNSHVPWPSLIDGLRPYTKKIWLAWTSNERIYFLKKIKPFWEVARHRIPAKSAASLNDLMNKGQLELKKGYIVEANVCEQGIEIVYRSENRDSRQLFQRVINCTGPESNYRNVRFPLITDLINRGKVQTDELGLGIECTPEGKIVNKDNQIEQGLWCIGPMRKAALWETTALREIREQALELTTQLGGKINS